MSDNDKSHEMLPISGENIEVDGIYRNEWGHEMKLERGRIFPADPELGTTEWEMVQYVYDGKHHEGHTDPRLIPKKDESE